MKGFPRLLVWIAQQLSSPPLTPCPRTQNVPPPAHLSPLRACIQRDALCWDSLTPILTLPSPTTSLSRLKGHVSYYIYAALIKYMCVNCTNFSPRGQGSTTVVLIQSIPHSKHTLHICLVNERIIIISKNQRKHQKYLMKRMI